MRYKRFILALMAFITLCGSLLMIINTDKPPTPERAAYSDYRAQDMVVPIPRDFKRPTPTPLPNNKVLNYHKSILRGCYLDKIPITAKEIVITENLGRYYITAYCNCSRCCTYPDQATASGIYPHYSEDKYTPTTCAIDPRLHSFNSLFLIDDKLYIAEDTGSAVKNKHIDLYFDNHSLVSSYGSHYENIYAVEIVEYTEPAVKYDVRRLIQEAFITNTRP